MKFREPNLKPPKIHGKKPDLNVLKAFEVWPTCEFKPHLTATDW